MKPLFEYLSTKVVNKNCFDDTAYIICPGDSLYEELLETKRSEALTENGFSSIMYWILPKYEILTLRNKHKSSYLEIFEIPYNDLEKFKKEFSEGKFYPNGLKEIEIDDLKK